MCIRDRTKAPADYTAGEILRAIEGSVAPIPCLGSETNELSLIHI